MLSAFEHHVVAECSNTPHHLIIHRYACVGVFDYEFSELWALEGYQGEVTADGIEVGRSCVRGVGDADPDHDSDYGW